MRYVFLYTFQAVFYYFFAKLVAHHKVMQSAMKCKQQVNPDFADALDHAVDDFAKMYLPGILFI